MENQPIKGDVVYVVPDRLSRTYKWEKDSDQLNKGVDVISINDIERRMTNSNLVVLDTPVFKEDDVYIRHPYLPNTYIKANRDPVDLFVDRFYAISDVMQLLGVTEISAEVTLTEAYKRTMNTGGNLKIKFVKAELDIKTETQKLRQKTADLKRVYANPVISYEKALAKAKENGTITDSKVRSLIEQRNPNAGGSVLKEDYIHVNISDQLNESLDVAFSINVLKVFSIGASYHEAIVSKNMIDYKIRVKF